MNLPVDPINILPDQTQQFSLAHTRVRDMIYEFDDLTSWIGFAQPVYTTSETFFCTLHLPETKVTD